MTRIDELRERIRRARDSYWAVGISTISDQEYDALVEELHALTGEYDKVVGPTVISTGKVMHPQDAPMLSMQKVYSESEIVKWILRLGENIGDLLVMPKYDGIALRRYNTGVYATRGDGRLGENVSGTASRIRFDVSLSSSFFIDGEAVCKLSDFPRLAHLGYKNPRNAVSGILGSKDHLIQDRAALLTFVPYTAHAWGIIDAGRKEKWELAELVHAAVENVKAKCFDYPMDGIVFRVSNPQLFKKLDHTDHHWRGQIALKFKGEQAQTTILRIDWQVKNGTVTPVALLQPVTLDGAEISRVTLHNADYVSANAVCEGDAVIIERAGGVIPSVVRVLHGKKIGWPVIPKECPVCHNQLLRSGARLYCPVCEAKGDQG